MQVNSTQFILGVLLLVAITCGIIFVLKWVLRKERRTLSTTGSSGSFVTDRLRRSRTDVFHLSGPLKLLGFAIAIAVSLLTINWTTYELPVYEPDNSIVLSALVEVVPVTFAPPAPAPPKQPEYNVIEIPREILPVESEPVIIDTIVSVEIPKADTSRIVGTPIDPPALRNIDADQPDVFVVVEEMPRFRGCADLDGTSEEKRACSEKKLYEFIYRHVRYPAVARDNNIEGRVSVRFIVEKDGSVSNMRIVQDIGGGCGEEVLRVVDKMNALPQAWSPGKQRGQPVRVQFTLPVTFRLTD